MISKPRIGISMNHDQVSALNRVLEMLEHGGDTSVVRRSADYREARAIVARSAITVRTKEIGGA